MTSISKQFRKYNFHDHTIGNIEIIPSTTYGKKKAKIILSFQSDDGKTIELQFADCRNIHLLADFDLLKDNSAAGNTSHTETIEKPKKIIKLIKKIENVLNIEHEGLKSPVEKKIEKIERFTCFIIYFFGGALRVVAKESKISKH